MPFAFSFCSLYTSLHTDSHPSHFISPQWFFHVSCNKDNKYFKHFLFVYTLFISQLHRTNYFSPNGKQRRDTRRRQEQVLRQPARKWTPCLQSNQAIIFHKGCRKYAYFTEILLYCHLKRNKSASWVLFYTSKYFGQSPLYISVPSQFVFDAIHLHNKRKINITFIKFLIYYLKHYFLCAVLFTNQAVNMRCCFIKGWL